MVLVMVLIVLYLLPISMSLDFLNEDDRNICNGDILELPAYANVVGERVMRGVL